MRHRQRHLHRTILDHLRTELTSLGWTTGDGNFGSPLVTFMDYEPVEAGETPPLNRVAVSMGDQGEDLTFELGGGLYVCRYTVFCDIYPANSAVGAALGDDIKDSLTDRVMRLRDYTSLATGRPTTNEIEFESVLVEVIPTATTTLDKRSWRSVKATAVLYYAPDAAPTDPTDPTVPTVPAAPALAASGPPLTPLAPGVGYLDVATGDIYGYAASLVSVGTELEPGTTTAIDPITGDVYQEEN